MRAGIIALVLLFAVAVYFVAFPETKLANRDQSQVSADNLFFVPKPVSNDYGVELLEYGEILLSQDKYDDAVSVFGSVFANDPSADAKAKSMVNAGVALSRKNDSVSRKHAREVLGQYLRDFSEDDQADVAHYYLGAIEADEENVAAALAHFTTVIADHPHSGFFGNAVFQSKRLAAIIHQQDETSREKVLRVLRPLLPRNPAALITLLGYLVSIMGWLVYDWEKVTAKLKARHIGAWAVLLLSVSLVAVNYAREWSHSASILDAPKILQPLRR